MQVSVKANVANASGELRLDLPAGWKAEPRAQAFKVPVAGEQQEMTFEITPPAGETTASLRAIATVGGRAIDRVSSDASDEPLESLRLGVRRRE